MSKLANKNIAPRNKLVVFQSKEIRIIWHNEEWFYSVIDIGEVHTDSPTLRQYWGNVNDREFIRLELSPIWVQLKLTAIDADNKDIRDLELFEKKERIAL